MRMAGFSSIAFVAALAACQADAGEGAAGTQASSRSSASASGANASVSTSAGGNGSASARSESRANGALTVKEETDSYYFDYAWPAPAGRLPGLAAELERRMDEAKAGLIDQTDEARADAEANDYPYRPHSYAMEWQVVADLPGWISLSGMVDTYQGGAHGNQFMQSLVWDKDAARGYDGVELFTSAAALQRALGARYCDGMRQAWLEKMDEVPEGRECPDLADLEVLVGSSNGRTFDRLTLVAAPYVAGSYAEGFYEIDLSVDSRVRGAVKPQFRAAFGG